LNSLKIFRSFPDLTYQNTLKDNFDNLPIHYAAQYNRADIVSHITTLGVKVDQLNRQGWSASHFAAQKGNIEILRILYSSKDPLTQPNCANWIPLHYALKYGHKDCTRFLLRVQAYIPNDDKGFLSLIHLAASKGDLVSIQTFLEKKLELDVINQHQWNFVHFAVANGSVEMIKAINAVVPLKTVANDIHQRTLVHIAAINDKMELLDYLIQMFPNTGGDKFMKTPLHYACEFGYGPMVTFLIKQKVITNGKEIFDQDINSQDVFGNSPLHYAVLVNNINIVKLLLHSQLITINIKNKRLETPLFVALNKGYIEIFKLLLEKGADFSITNNFGRTLFYHSVINNQTKLLDILMKLGGNPFKPDSRGWTPVHFAAQLGNVQILQMLASNNVECLLATDLRERTSFSIACMYNQSEVIRFLLDVNEPSLFSPDVDGNTPLHLSIIFNHASLTRILLRHSSFNMNEKNNQDETALHLAVKHRLNDTVKDLLRTQQCKINLQDKKGLTPLMIAVIEGNLVAIELLLAENTINCNVCDKNGWTAAHFAAIKRSSNVIELLYEKGKCNFDWITKKGLRPIDLAAQKNMTEVVTYLVGVFNYLVEVNGSQVTYGEKLRKKPELDISAKAQPKSHSKSPTHADNDSGFLKISPRLVNEQDNFMDDYDEEDIIEGDDEEGYDDLSVKK
jgi:ankyrin repeat protein